MPCAMLQHIFWVGVLEVARSAAARGSFGPLSNLIANHYPTSYLLGKAALLDDYGLGNMLICHPSP